MSNVKIELLTNEHARKSFDCEVEALNKYLQQIALQHQKKSLSRTHVLTFKDPGSPILAYATLNVCEIDLSDEKDNPDFKKLPRTLPALRLCRLAVDKQYKQKGLGKHLMGFTLAKAHQVSNDVGCAGLIVDAKDESAKTYYELYGFIPFTSNPLRLFLPIATIIELIKDE